MKIIQQDCSCAWFNIQLQSAFNPFAAIGNSFSFATGNFAPSFS